MHLIFLRFFVILTKAASNKKTKHGFAKRESNMKKLIVILVLATVLAGTAFADHPDRFGIGIYGNIDNHLFSKNPIKGFGAGLTLKFTDVPVFFYFDFINKFNHVSAAGDYYFIDKDIGGGPWHWYFGLGLGVALWGFDKNDKFGLASALRIPVGVSFQPFTLFELFIQAVPQVGVRFSGHEETRRGRQEGFGIYNRFWGGNIGIRFWL